MEHIVLLNIKSDLLGTTALQEHINSGENKTDLNKTQAHRFRGRKNLSEQTAIRKRRQFITFSVNKFEKKNDNTTVSATSFHIGMVAGTYQTYRVTTVKFVNFRQPSNITLHPFFLPPKWVRPGFV